MKTPRKTMYKALLCLVMLAGFTATAQKRTITINQLPAAAQAFIKNNFSGQTADYIVEDKGFMETEYEVRLANGTEIEFDGSGNWEEIDGNNNPIPAAILPKGINSYINGKFKGQAIHKADKKRYGYDIELVNGLELEFDSTGKFLRLDD